MILNLLVLRSRAPHELARFYERLGLSFTSERHGNGPEHLACTTQGAVFEIYPEQEGYSTSGIRIGFAVQDVDACYAVALAGNGDSIRQPTTSPWGRRAVIRDPAGHLVELTQRQPH